MKTPVKDKVTPQKKQKISKKKKKIKKTIFFLIRNQTYTVKKSDLKGGKQQKNTLIFREHLSGK